MDRKIPGREDAVVFTQGAWWDFLSCFALSCLAARWFCIGCPVMLNTFPRSPVLPFRRARLRERTAASAGMGDSSVLMPSLLMAPSSSSQAATRRARFGPAQPPPSAGRQGRSSRRPGPSWRSHSDRLASRGRPLADLLQASVLRRCTVSQATSSIL